MQRVSLRLLVVFMIGGLVFVGVRYAANMATTGSTRFTVTLISGPDLALTMTASPDPVKAGSTLTYAIEIENLGPKDTTDPMTVTDELPDGLTFADGGGGGFLCSAVEQAVTCTRVDPLDAGSKQSFTLEVTVSATAVPSVTNTATLSTPGDGDLSNNEATVTTEVLAGPMAHAGPDQNAKTGTVVTLNGSDSFDPNGGLISYRWTIEPISGESTLGSENVEGGNTPDLKPAESMLFDADIEGRDTPNPTFMPDVDGLYIIRLIVSDGEVESEPDPVEIRATSGNVEPNARAGRDLNALTGTLVTLDGTASHDPDRGPSLVPQFNWTFKELPVESALQNSDIEGPDQAQPSFQPDVTGTFVLTLEVSDGQGSNLDEVTVTVSESNVPPNASAGADHTATLGDEVVLDATGSNDPDKGPNPLSLNWRFVSLPPGSSLDNTGITQGDVSTTATGNARFTPDVVGEYVLRVEVSDGDAGEFDNVLITVDEAPLICDVDGDGDIDSNDIIAIFFARGSPAAPDDPRDTNGDGMITLEDLQLCFAQLSPSP